MRTLLLCLAGALIAVAITALSPFHTHIGTQVIEGPERYAVAAVGGTICAMFIRWAVRADRGL